MKKVFITVHLLIAILIMVGCAEKATETANIEGKISETINKSKTKMPVYEGIVKKIDLKSKTIDVYKENLNTGLAFSVSQAKLENYKSIKDIRLEDRVLVKYKVERGETIAVSVLKE